MYMTWDQVFRKISWKDWGKGRALPSPGADKGSTCPLPLTFPPPTPKHLPDLDLEERDEINFWNMPIVAVVALQFLAVWPLFHGGPDDNYSNLIVSPSWARSDLEF